MKHLLLRSIVVLMIAGATPGCTTVQPYERAFLAEPVMLSNRDHLAKGLEEHMHFSREAAYGGEGVGGGGCGCN